VVASLNSDSSFKARETRPELAFREKSPLISVRVSPAAPAVFSADRMVSAVGSPKLAPKMYFTEASQ
jgi:hypothetical protein